jgi:hypothetical protein
MGQAKINKQKTLNNLAAFEQVDLNAMSQAIQKLMSATSAAHGQDCVAIAYIAQAAFKELGVNIDVEVGHAAWRVGKAVHSVSAHHPDAMSADVGNFPGHAWNRIGRNILDFTTYQIPMKLREMDVIDGYITPIEWSVPDYLLVDQSTCTTFARVRDSYDVGIFSYDPVMQYRSKYTHDVDSETVMTLLAIYKMISSGAEVFVENAA